MGATGFEWVDEGKGGAHKWGYVGTVPGATLLLQISTVVSAGMPPTSATAPAGGGFSFGTSAISDASLVVVDLFYLQSYEHLGIAEVSCVQVRDTFWGVDFLMPVKQRRECNDGNSLFTSALV